jgi:CubicO group peptidase (beta-lactamase class C family)
MKKCNGFCSSRPLALPFILLFLFVGCNFDSKGQYAYESPEQINDDFAVGTLAEVGIDSTLIVKGINKIQQGKFKEIHSILIYKDGKLVLEEYFPGHKYQWDGPDHHGEWVTWDRSTPHHIMSATKSITSACIGIAIDKGFIKNVHQSIFDYLPEYKHLFTGGKEKITIEHLLTMTSGLEWDEWGAPLSSSKNDLVGLWVHCEDPIECILERPLKAEPGTNFTYSGGNMVLLGEIIRKAAKMTIDTFSEKYLFELFKTDSSNWAQRFENGVIYAGGGLIITPRDMIKIGVTYLNKGVWNGNRIVSEQWVEKSATSFGGNTGIKVPGEDSDRSGYSYSWWVDQFSHSGKTINAFHAGGWGGQKIMVIPELKTVVVFTGGNYLSKVREFKLLKKYIIPAIDSSS